MLKLNNSLINTIKCKHLEYNPQFIKCFIMLWWRVWASSPYLLTYFWQATFRLMQASLFCSSLFFPLYHLRAEEPDTLTLLLIVTIFSQYCLAFDAPCVASIKYWLCLEEFLGLFWKTLRQLLDIEFYFSGNDGSAGLWLDQFCTFIKIRHYLVPIFEAHFRTEAHKSSWSSGISPWYPLTILKVLLNVLFHEYSSLKVLWHDETRGQMWLWWGHQKMPVLCYMQTQSTTSEGQRFISFSSKALKKL